MKLTIAIVLVATLQVSATAFSQNVKFDLKVHDMTLRDALKRLENKSAYRFFFSDDFSALDQKVNIDVKNTSLESILISLTNQTTATYKILENDVVVISPFSQQQQRITGTVTDAATGEPLPGVNILVEGMNIGTISDSQGKYSIDVPDEHAVLVFSFIGYLSETVPLSGQLTIDVNLVPDIKDLDEVIVVGYGTVKKSDLTGAVGSVQAEEIASRQSTQISQALQGAVSGVLVTRDNNAPGASSTIRIRGITTIGDNEPLIIVDGVPADDLNDINPNDVESISVLKDGASASIYGSRAAAGVILVTTKRAKAGELAINYNFEYGFEKPTEMSDYVGSVRYMQMLNELRWNDNGNIEGGEYPTYTADVINNYNTLHAENPDLYPDTDWVDLVLKDNAARQSHTLDILGGSQTIRTKASLSYDEIGGLYEGKNYERLSARFNNDITINKFLSASLDLYVKRSISENPSLDDNDVIYNMRINVV